MRKKYLSALLFGALLVTSAGTFTSCKDYDDDINNLQEQITANADAIKSLEELVKAGKYVSGVAMEGQVITFTFSDGTTQTVTIPEGEKGQVVEVKDNELYIDGEATGIKVAEEAAVEAGLVKAEDGTWWVLGEDGEYTNTNIPVSGVTVSGSEKDGYTFTIYNEKGEGQTVKLPTVASSITNIDFTSATGVEIVNNKRADETVLKKTDGKTDVNANNDGNNYTFSQTKFDYDKFPKNFKASDWKGNKALPADESVILSSESTIDVRIDPVGTDATLVSYTLTNTKNQDAPGLELKAEAESSDKPLTTGEVAGRAGNLGNGLYTLSMDNKVLTKDEAKSIISEGLEKIGGEVAYAVNAGHATRSKYALNIIQAQAPTLTKLKFTQGSTEILTTTSLENYNGTSKNKVKVGVPVKVSGLEGKAVYDIYLEVADEDAKFKVTFDQDNHTFTIGQNPDWDTRDVDLDVIVWTAATDGTVSKTIVTVKLDSEYNTSSEYQAVTHDVAVEPGEDNVEYFDLQTMKNGFQSQDDLDSWIKNVNLSGTSFNIFTDEACTDENEVTSTGKLNFAIVSEKKTSDNVVQKGDKGASANFVRMIIGNNVVDDLKLDKQYYVKVTFSDAETDGNVLNSIVIPVTFTAPSVADQFVAKEGFVDADGNIVMYYDKNLDAKPQQVITYFKSTDESAKLEFANDDKITLMPGVDKTSFDLAQFVKESKDSSTPEKGYAVTDNATVASYVDLKDVQFYPIPTPTGWADGTGRELGYGQALTVKASNGNYKDTKWAYSDESKKSTKFTVKVMSPIYEGQISYEGDAISVKANNEGGVLITSDMLWLTDYNKNKYTIVPDQSSETGDYWSAAQIENVVVDYTKSEYISSVQYRLPKAATETTPAVEGAFVITARGVVNTVTDHVNIKVTDRWGYTKTFTNVPIQIVVE